MRVAIPLYNQDVAPRFGFADRFMIAEIQGGEVAECRTIPLTGQGFLEKLEEITMHGVDALLCGGFHSCFLPFAEKEGVTVYVGLTGSWQEILTWYLSGKPASTTTRRQPSKRPRPSR